MSNYKVGESELTREELESPAILRGDLFDRSVQHGGTHYKEMGIQPWDFVLSMAELNRDEWLQAVGFFRWNAFRYLARAGRKDDAEQEAQKSSQYVEVLEHLYALGKSKGWKK